MSDFLPQPGDPIDGMGMPKGPGYYSGSEEEEYEVENMMRKEMDWDDAIDLPKTAKECYIDHLMEAPTQEMPEIRESGGKKPSCNTGPKGVKADYEEAKFNQRVQRMMDAIKKEREMKKMAEGIQLFHPQQVGEQKGSQETAAKARKVRNCTDDEISSDDSSSDLDDSDDEAFQQYRLQRIKNVENSLPMFGTHKRITINEFGKMVKEVNEFVFVVAHIYKNYLEECVRLNYIFEDLAPQFPHVNFVRIPCTEAMPGYSDGGLPTLLIYRGGEMVKSIIRASDVIGEMTDMNVVKLLTDIGVIGSGVTANLISQTRGLSVSDF